MKNRECSGRWIVAVALVSRASVVLVRGLPPPVPGARPRRAELCPDCANSERKPSDATVRRVAFTNQHNILFYRFRFPLRLLLLLDTACPVVITSRRPCTLRGDPEPCRKADLRHRPSGFLPLGSLSFSFSFFSSFKRFVFHDTLPEYYLSSSLSSSSHSVLLPFTLSLSLSLPLKPAYAAGRILSAWGMRSVQEGSEGVENAPQPTLVSPVLSLSAMRACVRACREAETAAYIPRRAVCWVL